MQRSQLALAAVLTISSFCLCDDLAQAQPVPAVAGAPASNARPSFTTDVKAFAARVGTLSPDEAASGWLALFDRARSLPTDARRAYSYSSTQVLSDPDHALLITALPPATAWEALARQIDARPALPEPDKTPAADRRTALRAQSLLLLSAMLRGDVALQRQHLAALDTRVAGLAATRDALATPMKTLRAVVGLAPSTDGSNQALAAFEKELADATDTQVDRYGLIPGVDIPDLVALAGAERAEAILRKALVAKVELQIRSSGWNTQALVRRLAIELAPQMVAPQWELIDSPRETKLFEAMEARFGPKAKVAAKAAKALEKAAAATQPATGPASQPARRRGGGLLGMIFGAPPEPEEEQLAQIEEMLESQSSYGRMSACAYYAFGLILEDRGEEARTFMEPFVTPAADDSAAGMPFRIPYDAADHIGSPDKQAKVADTLRSMLDASPNLPLWDLYQTLSLRLGRADTAITSAKKALDLPALTPERRDEVRGTLMNALLAADRVPEGVALLRERLAAQVPSDSDTYTLFNLASSLATLGELEGNNEWRDAGIAPLVAHLSKATTIDYSIKSTATGTAQLLEHAGRANEAIDLLTGLISRDRLTRAKRKQGQMGGESEFGVSYDNDLVSRPVLFELLAIYHRGGEHAAIIELLDTFPDWQASDLAEVYREKTEDGTPIGYIAAHALAEVGRKDEAKKIVDAVLDCIAGFDPAYALRISLSDEADASARLDQLFARDPFEERPLIWKAELARRAGRLDDAERLARQAIAIDPSDGEQGPNRRMYVYAVLADTLEAKGDVEQTKLYRNVVEAIRESERADRFFSAGLLGRATKMYEHALTRFSDAYCIQSRLAVQLAALGRQEEAEAHYRKAYELMPDSFGRIESHCFGCEGAFKGEAPQRIAEAVFTKLAAEHPNDKPQVHYLLGYLRVQQGRTAEAAESFKVATRLDADYFNAWKKLHDAADQTPSVSQADRDAAGLAMFRLDPLNRHGGRSGLKTLRDLNQLWTTATAAQSLMPKLPTELLPLPASAKSIAEKTQAVAAKQRGGLDDLGDVIHGQSMFHDEAESLTISPGEALMQVDALRALTAVMGSK